MLKSCFGSTRLIGGGGEGRGGGVQMTTLTKNIKLNSDGKQKQRKAEMNSIFPPLILLLPHLP